MRKILFLLFFCTLSLGVFAQNCTQKLVQAERDYEAGRLAGIPNALAACLANKDGFSKEEQIRAYRLLTLVHIFTDNEPAAEEALVKLLKADPEHLLDESTDPAELFYMYDQFQVNPIFRLGLRVGVNQSLPSVMETFTTSNTNFDAKFYNGNEDGSAFTNLGSTVLALGFWGELTIEKHLGKGFEAVGGFQGRLSSYNVDNFYSNELEGTLSEDLNEELISTLTNQQFYGRVPLYIRYTYNYRRRTGVKPYAILGVSGDYLLSAVYSDATRGGGTPFTLNATAGEDDLKQFDQVNDFNVSAFVGLGIKIPARTHFLTFEFRYDNSFLNYINADNRYANQVVSFDLAHVEDNLTLNFVSFSVGYIHSIYNPKKKEKR